MLHDFEEINAVLNAMADEGIVEPMVEPCDCCDAHPLDWAEIAGIFDDVAEMMYFDCMES